MTFTIPQARHRALTWAGASLLAACALLSACASSVVADGDLLARADAVLRAGQPDSVRLQLSPQTLATGDTLSARIEARQPGYVYLYQIGTNGKNLTLVFPNEFDGDNALQANNTLLLPRAHWRLRAYGPEGVGYFLAVLAEQPQPVSTLSKAAGDGRFQIEGRYAAAMVTLREVAAR